MILVRNLLQNIDLGPLMDCDRKSYDVPYTEAEVLKFARGVTVGILNDDSEQSGRLVGYYIYGMEGTALRLNRFGVLPNWRRVGIGSRLMERFLDEASMFKKVTTVVPEANVIAQLFLRHHGWRAVNVVKDCFTNCGYPENGFYFLRRTDGVL